MKIIIKKKQRIVSTEAAKPASKAESDELLMARLTPENKKDPGIKHLLSMGYIPIIRARTIAIDQIAHSSVLGAGVQGTAYQVSKNGKKFVAKISNDPNEHRVRYKIEKIREKLPKSISKHIVQTYAFDRFVGKEEANRYSGDSYTTRYVFIMEELRPMSDYEKRFLGGR